MAYDSGCRPQEVKRMEARHVQREKHRAVIPTGEAKGKIRGPSTSQRSEALQSLIG